jgi:Lamin Tail Domain
MLKNTIYLLVFLILIVSGSCKKTYIWSPGEVVVNEVMPHNSTTVTDQNGEYDDWIELYNLSVSDIDLSGFFLSDKRKDLTRWKFPQGTFIPGQGYLIIWADKDTTELGLHANFKLSSEGEKVILTRANRIIMDEVEFPAQTLELSYSRRPNGTGSFTWQTPTFCKTNDYK